MRLHAAAPLVLLVACRTDADESLAQSCGNISGACSCDLGGGAALHWDCAAAPPAVVAELAWAGGRDAVLVDERCGFEAELAPWLARRAGVDSARVAAALGAARAGAARDNGEATPRWCTAFADTWLATRARDVRAMDFGDARAPSLNVGCGPLFQVQEEGCRGMWDPGEWVHLDADPRALPNADREYVAWQSKCPDGSTVTTRTLRHDVTTGLSMIANASLASIFAEHVAEHLPPETVPRVLAEFWRVLRPGGTLRLSTPDLRKFAAAYLGRSDTELDFVARAHRWAPRHPSWEAPEYSGAAIVNDLFRNHGHDVGFIWDAPSLTRAMVRAGIPSDAIAEDAYQSGKPLSEFDSPLRRAESFYLAAARKRRVLLADCVFPSDMARWRLVEVKAFMERYDTDILVPNRIDNYKGFEIPFAWTEDLNASHHLYEYDILIFNEFYNALQQFNDPVFDGVAWNGKFPADYLLRKKSRRGERDVVLQRYDAVYSIFKMVADFFHGRYPASRHLAKFYPGGGFTSRQEARRTWPPDLHVVVTQAATVDFMRRHAPENPRVKAFGAPYLLSGATPTRKAEQTGPLRVCFAHLGDVRHKGADLYARLAEAFVDKWPEAAIFYGIGVPASPAVVPIKPMAQAALDAFYAAEVDVYVSLERLGEGNGWPLGGEAMLAGCVLVTTDVAGMNKRNGYDFGDHVSIVELDDGRESFADIDAVLATLHGWATDRGRLATHGRRAQDDAYALWGADAMLEPIWRHLESCVFPEAPMGPSCSAGGE